MSEIVHRIEPEYLCGFAPSQEFVAGDGPTRRDAVRPIQLEFDEGARGCFIANYGHYGAIRELIEAWQAAGITGFTTATMICVPNPIAAEIDPEYQPPAYVEVIVNGAPQDDLHHVVGETQVRVSRKAAAIYSHFDPGAGTLLVGTESDTTGRSLPDGVKAAARSF